MAGEGGEGSALTAPVYVVIDSVMCCVNFVLCFGSFLVQAWVKDSLCF